MIGYVMVGTNDLEASTKFYDAVLDTLGLTRGLTDTDYIGYGSKTAPENIEFYLTKPFDPEELLLLSSLLEQSGTKITSSQNSMEIKKDNKVINSLDISTAPYPGFPTDLQAQFMALMALGSGISCLLYTSPSPRDATLSRMPSSA